MERFQKLVRACLAQDISDLHLTGGHPVVFRKGGQVYPHKDIAYTPAEVDNLAARLLSPRQKAMLRRRWSVDLGLSLAGARLRVNVFSTMRGLSLAVRFLPGKIPGVEQLNLLPALKDFARTPAGLVLFCGATGSGKTTTIAALIQEINRTRQAHVVTLEDPVEYRFASSRAFVEQRELGVHFSSYEQGLADVLRQAPDVIVVGELREAETIRLTLDAAESGHLVYATLHASTAEEALYRMCNAFPSESQEFVRFQLSTCLAGVVVQQLVSWERLGFRVPLLSITKGIQAVKGLIRDNKLSQMESTLEMGRGQGLYTFDRYRSEFLETKTNFIPPSVNFRPSPEASPETTHLSSLVDLDIQAPAQVPSGSPAPGAAEEPDQVLDLSGEPDLDQIIAQLQSRSPAGE